MSRHTISAEALTDLRRRLGTLPPRSPERRHMIQATAALYGVSEPTLYRRLRQHRQPVGPEKRFAGRPGPAARGGTFDLPSPAPYGTETLRDSV